MSEATCYLRLPLEFDRARLAAELALAQGSQWQAHANTQAYRGRWRCIALRSASGLAEDISAFEGVDFHDTALLRACHYLREVIDSFDCEKKSVRLMSLEAGGQIQPHRDHGGSFEDGLARLHVPLQTDPAVLFTLDGEDVHFSAGATWYMNANCLHAVRNGSARERVHLVLDCVPNAWLRALFDAAGFVPNPPPRYGDRNINDANVWQVIAALRADASPGALAMAARLAALAPPA